MVKDTILKRILAIIMVFVSICKDTNKQNLLGLKGEN